MGLNCLFGSPTVQCKPTMVSLPTSTGRFVRISYLVTGPRKRILTYRGSITVLLTCLDGLDAIRQVNILLFNKSKAAESKQVKLEVSHADIFPLRVSNPCLCVLSK